MAEEDEGVMVEAFTRDLARCHLGRHLRIPLLPCQERVKAALTGADWEGRRGLQGKTEIRKGQEREEHGQGLGVPHSVLKGGGSEKCFFLRQPKVCFGQLGQVFGCSTLGSTFE